MPATVASRVRAFVESLPQTERYIALLFWADNLTATEIGLVLDKPVTAVERAIGQLREQIDAIVAPASEQQQLFA